MLKLLRALIVLPFLAVGSALAVDTPFDAAKFDALNHHRSRERPGGGIRRFGVIPRAGDAVRVHGE